MTTVSSPLPLSTIRSTDVISSKAYSSPAVKLQSHRTGYVKVTSLQTAKTPVFRRGESVTVCAIPPGDPAIEGWRLKSALLVQIRWTRKQCLAITWLEGVSEYGAGATEAEAIEDLIVSIGEYRDLLERREANLGNPKELAYLRTLIEPA